MFMVWPRIFSFVSDKTITMCLNRKCRRITMITVECLNEWRIIE